MHPVRVVVVTSFALVACVGSAHARQAPSQPRPATGQTPPVPGQPRAPRTGTGRIRGRVVADESGSPVRRAQVRLASADGLAKLVTTDADGRYEFAALPEGRFNLFVRKVGFVDTQYGQTHPLEAGKALDLADKQAFDRADIVVPRGSAIVGQIVDEFGEPLAEAMVSAARRQWVGGRRRLMSAGSLAQTNDLGEYRLYGLPPGDYYVSATVRNNEAMMVDMALGPSSNVIATPQFAPSGYAPMYFPGTPSPAEAQKVTVAAGQDSHGIDFQLIPIRMARITGVVVNSQGHPVEGAMILAYPSRGMEGGSGPFNARSTKEGTFTFSAMPPGDYSLQATATETVTTTSGGTTTVSTTQGDVEFGVVPLSVGGDDVRSVVIATSKGASVRGRIIFEGERPRATTGVRVTAPGVDALTPVSGGPSAGTLKADDTFEQTNLAGVRQFRVLGLPAGWSVKAVTLNGSDITDSGVEFKGTDPVSGLEIVVSSRSTDVAGAVIGADGKPARDYSVVIFSDDPQKWRSASGRWITGARPAQDGRFRVRSMPPGGYYAVAVDYLPQGDWYDPEVLERLREKAQRFALGEGESKTLDLKISGGA